MPQPYKLKAPYVRTNTKTGERFHLFTIQLPAMLWPEIDRQARQANVKHTPYLSQMLQWALLKKGKSK